MRLYTMYDEIAEEASPLFEAKNDAMALRMFKKVEMPKEYDQKDFKLYCVGSFKHDPVELMALSKPRLVLRESDFDESEDAAEDVKKELLDEAV